MCFSATASFAAATALGATGVVTLKNAKSPSDRTFASIPLIFGVQQFIEGVIWIAPQASLLNTVMTYAFNFFSNLFWPTFIPLAVLRMETVHWRKIALRIFLGIGITTSIYLLYFYITAPIKTEIIGHSIGYIISDISPTTLPLHHFTFYFSATCISCFFSSHRFVNLFGLVALISGLLAYQMWTLTFVSVWCFFMAVMSMMICVYFFQKNRAGR